MIFFALSGLINGLCCYIAGRLCVSSKTREFAAPDLCPIICLAISVWSYSYFQWLTAHDVDGAAYCWARALMAGAIFIPVTAFHHLVKLINKKISRRFIKANYVFSALLFLMSFSPWVVRDVTPEKHFSFLAQSGTTLSRPFFTVRGIGALGSLDNLERVETRLRTPPQPVETVVCGGNRRLGWRIYQLPPLVRLPCRTLRQHLGLCCIHSSLHMQWCAIACWTLK